MHVLTNYSFSIRTEVDLPEGKTGDDIESIGVKWSTIFIHFKDGTVFERSEDDFDLDFVDWKYPGEVEAFADNGDAECPLPDYDTPIYHD